MITASIASVLTFISVTATLGLPHRPHSCKHVVYIIASSICLFLEYQIRLVILNLWNLELLITKDDNVVQMIPKQRNSCSWVMLVRSLILLLLWTYVPIFCLQKNWTTYSHSIFCHVLSRNHSLAHMPQIHYQVPFPARFPTFWQVHLYVWESNLSDPIFNDRFILMTSPSHNSMLLCREISSCIL